MLGVVFMIVRLDQATTSRTGSTRPGSRPAAASSAARHPQAGRFNAGQKMIFWSVVARRHRAVASPASSCCSRSRSPTSTACRSAQYIHAVVGVILIAIIIAHIYIGSLGMEGAYDAMGSGEVDLAWARRTTAPGSRSSRRRPRAARKIGRGRAPAPAE